MYHFLVVCGALALVVVLLRLRWKTGLALVASAAVLALALPARPTALLGFLRSDWAGHPWSTTFGVQTADLVLLVVLVNFLGQVLREKGLSERLTAGLRAVFRSRRLAVAGVPAVMGLLPSPGGIMLSAPMVRDAAESYGLSGAKAALINYWFRHQWECVFPLFPAVPLVASFLAVPVVTLMKWNLIVSLAGAALGGIVLLRGFPPAEPGAAGRPGLSSALAGIGAALWPVALALGLCLGLQLPAGLSLAAAVALLVLVLRMRPTEIASIFRQGTELDLILVVIGAMAYRAILDAGGAVGSISAFIAGLGLPVTAMVYLLPFIVGLATGLTSATMALAFPLLLGLVAPPGAPPDMRLAMLAFCGGLAGIWLTPVHLCLALSRDYFKTSFAELYKYLLPLVLLVSAAAFAAVLVRF
jgi:integral membrane protein (TIGR00529 family)